MPSHSAGQKFCCSYFSTFFRVWKAILNEILGIFHVTPKQRRGERWVVGRGVMQCLPGERHEGGGGRVILSSDHSPYFFCHRFCILSNVRQEHRLAVQGGKLKRLCSSMFKNSACGTRVQTCFHCVERWGGGEGALGPYHESGFEPRLCFKAVSQTSLVLLFSSLIARPFLWFNKAF